MTADRLISARETCDMMGWKKTPGKGGEQNRRRKLNTSGLTRYTVKGKAGYWYDRKEVELKSKENIQLAA